MTDDFLQPTRPLVAVPDPDFDTSNLQRWPTRVVYELALLDRMIRHTMERTIWVTNENGPDASTSGPGADAERTNSDAPTTGENTG